MDWRAVAIGLIPSIGVALVFWLAIRSVVRADRHERAALAAIEDADGRADAHDSAVPDEPVDGEPSAER